MSTRIDKGRVDRFKYWLIGIINGIDPRMLVQMIKDNDVPLLFDYDLPDYFDWVKDYVIEHKQEILAQINYETVMKYSKEFRPDLKVLLEHPRGRKWLERFMKVVSFMIENADLSPIEMKLKFIQKIKAIHRTKIAEKEKEFFLAQQMQEEAEMEEELERQRERERIENARLMEKKRKEREKREKDLLRKMNGKQETRVRAIPSPQYNIKDIVTKERPITKLKQSDKKDKNDYLSDMYGV